MDVSTTGLSTSGSGGSAFGSGGWCLPLVGGGGICLWALRYGRPPFTTPPLYHLPFLCHTSLCHILFATPSICHSSFNTPLLYLTPSPHTLHHTLPSPHPSSPQPPSPHTPLVNRMTDRCKKITLPQTSFAGGNNPFDLPAYPVPLTTELIKPIEIIRTIWIPHWASVCFLHTPFRFSVGSFASDVYVRSQ